MAEPYWLEPYWRRFRKRFWKDSAPWARDNIVWGMIVLVVPPLAAYIHDSDTQVDWLLIKNSLLLYAFALAIYIAVYFARTAKNLDADLVGSIGNEIEKKRTLEQELAEINKVPPAMDIQPVELYRVPIDAGRDRDSAGRMGWDVFCLVRINLRSPNSVSVVNYKLTLCANGAQLSFDSLDNLGAFEVKLWTPKTFEAFSIPKLPTDLKAGEPAEGWLHFIVPRATPEGLDQSSIRIIVDTGNGKAFGEHRSSSQIWNPDSSKRFGRKT